MWLVVGLGNPGSKYQYTRHNVGFMAVIAYLKKAGEPQFRSEHKALTTQVTINDHKAIFALPQTFMNLSGDSVLALMQFYKVELDHLIVLHDDIDQPFGSVRIHKKRGHGGQNGIRHIHEVLATNEYARIKIGIGRPAHDKMDVMNHVLGNFSGSEAQGLTEVLARAGDALNHIFTEGVDKAANKFNGLKPLFEPAP
jgi:peptidyl-tRNA hydrolase, PTH1 family